MSEEEQAPGTFQDGPFHDLNASFGKCDGQLATGAASLIIAWGGTQPPRLSASRPRPVHAWGSHQARAAQASGRRPVDLWLVLDLSMRTLTRPMRN